MKTTFTLQQVKQLLSLPSAQQQQILDYGDSLSAASDEEIAGSTVASDAPELIHDLHRRSVRRARAAISRRKRKQQSELSGGDCKADRGDNRLSHGAIRRLQWLRDTFQTEIGEAVRSYICRVTENLSTLSSGQYVLASRRAHAIIIQLIRPLLASVVAG